jgi:predicted MFS family arabinose efflux permease
MVTIGLVLYALAYTSFLLPWASVIAAGFYMLFISFGEIFVMPFSSNFTMLRSGKLNQGQYMAYYIMTYSVANTIAPLLGTQIIAKFGFAALWGLMTVFALVSWTGFRMLNRVMN